MKLTAFINGKPVKTTKYMDIYNPSTKTLLGSISSCSKLDIDEAFNAAQKAFLKFKDTSIEYREEVLGKVMKALSDNREELATLLSKEVAKPYKDALTEIDRSVQYIDETISEYKKVIANPRQFSSEALKTPGLTAIYNFEPVGVVLAITPFNYPINLLVAKLAPAIIAGNSMVIKSPSSGSLVTSKFIEHVHNLGIDAGIINLVTGAGSEIGDYIIKNHTIRLVSFTGSTGIAKGIAKEQVMIPMILENGGKDPAIIMPDADIKTAAKDIANGGFNFSGQRCTAIKRIIVHKSIADEFINELNEVVNNFIVADPFQENVTIIPLISERSLKFNLELLNDAIAKKAKLHQKVKHEGNLLWPVVVSKVNRNMLIWSEEPFGPILPVITYEKDEEAIELANDSIYGLQASIFTKDIEKAKAMVPKIEAGTVNINKPSSRGPDILPFFGVKDSGFGIQGITDSILSCLKIKGTVIKE
ncbi:MAG: aldehyde dehydrogenase family protein [Mycoplasma sp.]